MVFSCVCMDLASIAPETISTISLFPDNGGEDSLRSAENSFLLLAIEARDCSLFPQLLGNHANRQVCFLSFSISSNVVFFFVILQYLWNNEWKISTHNFLLMYQIGQCSIWLITEMFEHRIIWKGAYCCLSREHSASTDIWDLLSTFVACSDTSQ